ncbi:MAG: hypothetical protein KIT87_28180 [Anaerolineae bacterium]|nr:hypothetical protein [Anaerolineae bacterium]
MTIAYLVVMAYAVAALGLSWLYFRRYQVTRPPIGVFDLGDIAVMLVAIVIVPLLYLWLPLWLAASLLTLGVGSVLYTTWEPILRRPWAIWLVTLGLVGADIGAAWLLGPQSFAFSSINNVVLILSIVGATNLWAQSGMRARDAAWLGAGLMIYDFVATSLLTMMSDMVNRLAGLPFAPFVFGGDLSQGYGLGIGLGDLLMASVFPLVMRKAYGRRAGLTAFMLGLAAIAIMMAVLALGWLQVNLPAMVILGPLMVLQYRYWRRRAGQERTTWQYLQAEPGRAA